MTSFDDSALRANLPRQGDTLSDLRSANTVGTDARVSDHTAESVSSAESGPRLGALAPADPRGRHELLRLAAGLAPQLHGPTGDQIAQATTAMGIEPAHVERVVSSVRDAGVIALIDGTLYALGRHSFLEDIGVRPRLAEMRVAERIERSGDLAYFIVAIARAHCLGVFGAPSNAWRTEIPPAH